MSTLPAMPRVQYDLIRLRGGLDQVTPTLSLPPGFVRRSTNFEASITGGYTRIAGYERFDGRVRQQRIAMLGDHHGIDHERFYFPLFEALGNHADHAL
mgnify:CR=1 FL=1